MPQQSVADCYLKLEFHGTETDTDTDTHIGMRVSCNFVNVYSITYCVQYTFTRVHARTPNGHPREDLRRKIACVGQVGGQVGEDPRRVRLGQTGSTTAADCQLFLW